MADTRYRFPGLSARRRIFKRFPLNGRPALSREGDGQEKGTGKGRRQTKNRLTLDARGVARWNGAAIDRLTLRRYLARSMTLPVEPELQFEPAADARYVMVDELLADIRRAGVTKMGFVGNDRYGRF